MSYDLEPKQQPIPLSELDPVRNVPFCQHPTDQKEEFVYTPERPSKATSELLERLFR